MDPTGLFVDGGILTGAAILAGAKVATMAISYAVMKADQHFNHLPQSTVAQQNHDFNRALSTVTTVGVAQGGMIRAASPASAMGMALDLSVNKQALSGAMGMASGFTKGLLGERGTTPGAESGFFGKAAGLTGKLLGESFRDTLNQFGNSESSKNFPTPSLGNTSGSGNNSNGTGNFTYTSPNF